MELIQKLKDGDRIGVVFLKYLLTLPLGDPLRCLYKQKKEVPLYGKENDIR